MLYRIVQIPLFSFGFINIKLDKHSLYSERNNAGCKSFAFQGLRFTYRKWGTK